MADGGELVAVFKGLASDAADAGEDIGSSASRWFTDTADIADENSARTLGADAENARLLNDIHPDDGELPDGGAGNVSADSEDTSRIARLLNGEDPDAIDEDNAPGIGGKKAPISAENGSQRLFNRKFPELTEVNGSRFAQGPEWQHNCQSCVNAVDHTLDGAPASAVPVPKGGFPWPDSVTKTIGGGKPFVKVSGYDDITDQLTSAGDGSRGVVWGRRFMQVGNRSIEVEGHVFNVVNSGGRVFYVDGQTGTFAKLENFGSLHFLRTK